MRIGWWWVCGMCAIAGCAGPTQNQPQSPAAAAEPARTAKAPSIDLVDEGGKPVPLSSLVRPVTVIAMWATWCKGCIEEMPRHAAFQQAMKADPDLAIVTVSSDEAKTPEERAKVKAFAEEKAVPGPLLFDPDHKLMDYLTGRIPLRPGEARNKKPEETEILLPLHAILDCDFNVYFPWSVDGEDTVDGYRAGMGRLVDLARQRRLPPSQPRPKAGASDQGTPTPFSFRVPKPMAPDELEAFLRHFRGTLEGEFTHLTPAQVDALIGEIRTQLTQGTEAMILVPGKPREDKGSESETPR